MNAYDDYAPGDAGVARAAHSSFLMIAAELGLPALLVFGFVLAAGFRALGRVAKRATHEHGALARGLQTSLFGFIVCSLFGTYTFTWPLFFILGMATAAVMTAEHAALGEEAR